MKTITSLQVVAILFAISLFCTCGTKINTEKLKPPFQTIAPNMDCPEDKLRPVFEWTPFAELPQDLSYNFVLIELKEGQNAEAAISRNPKIIEQRGIKTLRFEYPAKQGALRPNKVYAYQVSAVEGNIQRPKVLGKTDVGLFYIPGQDWPDYFQEMLCCKNNQLGEGVNQWATAYGSPSLNAKATGCLQQSGTIDMKGHNLGGDAVWTTLSNTNKIKKGIYYQLSLCLQAYPKQLDYFKIRVLAFNGDLPSDGGHPESAANIAIIGESAKIKSTDWNRYFFSAWKAPKDYEHLAILAISDDSEPADIQAFGSISNICLQVADDCGFTALDMDFTDPLNPPESLKDYLSEEDGEPEEIDLEYNAGSLTDQYGPPFDENGNSNWYEEADDCISVGGEIPDEAKDLEKEDINFELPGGVTIPEFTDALDQFYDLWGKKLEFPKWGPIPGDKTGDCLVQEEKEKPFNGRDIIYVHGLVLDHILSKVVKGDQTGWLKLSADVTGFMNPNTLDDALLQKWPESPEEFFEGGFYHDKAEAYWEEHIDHYLGSVEEPSNRYMLVAFNSSQRLIDNVHAALTQIAMAMNEGVGVIYNKKDPRGPDCFGKEAVIISHSTGALVMDVAMSLANLSASTPKINASFGNAKYLSDHVKAHISLHGAIAGSELAGLGVVAANVAALTATGVDGAVDIQITLDNANQTAWQMFIDAITGLNTAGTFNNTDALEAFLDMATDSIVVITRNLVRVINNSVLVDLSPPVAKLLWGPYIQQTKVPVLTVAGGHPGAVDHSLATKFLLPGFDDGVVSTNSQSGSPSPFHPDQYLYIPPEARIFDKGIDFKRAHPYFAEQSRSTAMSAFGSIPWLSPTGMVQPVSIFVNPSPRYSNHFPFIQSTAEHNHSIVPNIAYMATFGASNYEESLVLENNTLFDDNLVNEDIAQNMDIRIRERLLYFKLKIPYPIVTWLPPPPKFSWGSFDIQFTIPLWKRTYHFFNDGNLETDYVYEFVLR